MEENHRCARCGRRLVVSEPPRSRPDRGPRTERAVRPPAVQAALFHPRGFPKGVDPDALPAPAAPAARAGAGQRSARETRAQAQERSRPRPAARSFSHQPVYGQGRLALSGAGAETVVGDSEVAEHRMACDARVATPPHRLLAFLLDGGLILAAIALFLLVYLIIGGRLPLDRQLLPGYLGLPAGLWLLYEFLHAVAGADTPGMRGTRLVLLDFDGRRPGYRQRVYRLAACLLSAMALGLGVVWALADEESLAWHDHISKTFPAQDDSAL